jgi:hypothetical protein
MFHLNENIERHCMQIELNCIQLLNLTQIELDPKNKIKFKYTKWNSNSIEFKFHGIQIKLYLNSIEEKWDGTWCKFYWNFAYDYGDKNNKLWKEIDTKIYTFPFPLYLGISYTHSNLELLSKRMTYRTQNYST